MNWIDTPLLVYASVAGHPAKSSIEEFLHQAPWGSSVLVLLETYQALVHGYGVPTSDAAAAVDQLALTTEHWRGLQLPEAQHAIAARQQQRLDAADAHLLRLAAADAGTLVTLDRRLLREARGRGVTARNPIGPALARAVADWEAEHLPAKGLGRFLSRTEQWLREEDARVADRFVLATEQLTRLPL